jgi:hypothetical protein
VGCFCVVLGVGGESTRVLLVWSLNERDGEKKERRDDSGGVGRSLIRWWRASFSSGNQASLGETSPCRSRLGQQIV